MPLLLVEVTCVEAAGGMPEVVPTMGTPGGHCEQGMEVMYCR